MEQVSVFLLEYLPSIIMLLIGFALVVLEMYLPGFGAPGVVGILLLAGGVFFAHPSMLGAIVMVLVLVALLGLAFSIVLRSASRGRLSRSKLVLRDVAVQQENEDGDLQYFVGRQGVTRTVLRPAGKADFDGVQLNVESDGEFIEAGSRIRVERVEGNRIVVRKQD